MDIVIAGLGAGGFAAALAIKKTNREAKIIIVDNKDYDLMHSCGLPYSICDKIKLDDLTHELPEMGFEKYLKHEVIGVKSDDKKIIAKDIDSGEEKEISYEKLILSTGADAFFPPIPGVEELRGKGLFCMNCPDDPKIMMEQGAKDKGKKAIVIGAGAIGLETAYALNANGLDVKVIEMLPCAFPKAIDKDISDILGNYMTEIGIDMVFEKKVEKILGDDKVTGVLVDGEEVPADIVVMAVGIRPNSGFAKDAGIEFGKWGILTDDKMMTNLPDVYAIGDIIQVKSIINGEDWMMQLASSAYKQGTVAGTNAAGGDAKYIGALNTFVSVIGEMEVASTGFNSHAAEGFGFDVLASKAKSTTKPEWAGTGEEITVKIIIDKKTQKVIGGQAIAKEGAAMRVNVLSTAIKAGFTLQEVADIELAYCPEVSQTYDILTVVADLGLRRLNR